VNLLRLANPLTYLGWALDRLLPPNSNPTPPYVGCTTNEAIDQMPEPKSRDIWHELETTNTGG
jgi:hypothetical protein